MKLFRVKGDFLSLRLCLLTKRCKNTGAVVTKSLMKLQINHKKLSKKHLSSLFLAGLPSLLVAELLAARPIAAQSEQTLNQDSAIGNNSSFNNVNQNALQNQNEVRFPDRVVYPLDYPIYTPVNTENDFGFNFSAGVNTLDSSNVTLFVGFIFQPGRTASHQARMERLRKETALLEVQKQTMEAQLSLLQKQVEEAELRLQRLRQPAEPLSPGQEPQLSPQ